ncbi:hypothetical protein WEI85_13915 [Actinomycetes bacterium KLBMP 9797]
MSDQLEARYRRLLAWYPWEHRRVYEEEMLGVLMAGARPGQRYPRLTDAANLLVSAGGRRLGVAVRGLAGVEWRDAAAVVGLLGALLLLGLRLHPYGRALAVEWWSDEEPRIIVSGGPAPRLAFWFLVTAAALLGLRRTAAIVAWPAVAWETALAVLRFPSEAGDVIGSMWPYLLAVLTAAALTVPATRHRARTLLGGRGLALAGAGVLVAAAAPVVSLLIGGRPEGGSYVFTAGLMMTALSACYLAGGALVAMAVWRLAAPVRRRVVVLFAPVIVVQLVIEQWFSGWRHSTSAPVPAQWAVLVLTPALTFAVGVAVVRWREERERLIALGRAADRAT